MKTFSARCLSLALLLASLTGAARADAVAPTLGDVPAAPAASAASGAASAADQDGALLWEEAVFTFNGLAYDIAATPFATRELADDCFAHLFQCKAVRSPMRHANVRNNELPLWLRDAVVAASVRDSIAPMRNPFDGRWFIVRVDAIRPAEFVVKVDPRAWLNANAAAALPNAQALRSDPELAMRRVMNRIRNAAELRRALAENRIDKAHLDMPMSNGSTLVSKTLDLHDTEFLEALVAEGASVDACGLSRCPLTQTIFAQDRDALRWLLAHGAKTTGSGKRLPALATAAMLADRASSEILLSAGADPLASQKIDVGGLSVTRSIAFYAPSTDMAYLDWWSDVVAERLAKTKQYEWSAWIEQGKTRQPVTEGASIALARQPFRLVMKAPDGVSFIVASSEDVDLAKMSRAAVFRRTLLAPGKLGASGPDGHFLSVGTMRVAEGQPDFDGATNELSFSTDRELDRGTKRVADRRGGHEDVYTVSELIGRSGPVAIEKFSGQMLYVVAGVVPPLGMGADFYRALRFRLVFP